MTVCIAVLFYFVYQVTLAILRYYEYATVTDVQVQYTTSLPFPAVTLCNQNNFRSVSLPLEFFI